MHSAFFNSLPANELGRDFLVGDLHGAYRALMRALAAHQFNPAYDRLFATGDLADRGPSPLDCLRLLHKPWFYCVQGNHEQLLLEWVIQGRDSPDVMRTAPRFGGDWIFRLSGAEWRELASELVPMIFALPRVLSVDHPVRPFQMLHAEAFFAGRAHRDDDLRQSYALEESAILWGRILYNCLLDSGSPRIALGLLDASTSPWSEGLGLTYVGHQVVPRPLLHMSHLYIDCGAYTQAEKPEFKATVLSHDEIVAELHEALMG